MAAYELNAIKYKRLLSTNMQMQWLQRFPLLEVFQMESFL